MTFFPEDLLLILCIHGTKHIWQRLAWICDVANLIEVCKEMDWERILDQSQQMKIERIVLLGVFLAKDLVGIELPGEIVRKFDHISEVQKLSTKVYGTLFNGVQNSDRVVDEHLFHLRLMERLTDKANYCLELGFIPNIGDWQYVSLPDSLFFFYYIIRPFHLALTFSSHLAKQIIKGSR